MQSQDLFQGLQKLAYCDSHAHLLDYTKQQFKSDQSFQQIMETAAKNGITHIVSNTTQVKEFQSMKQMVKNSKILKIIPSFGIHPWWTEKQKKQNQNWREQLTQVLKESDKYLIGQIGLDFRKNVLEQNSKQIQLQFFNEQMNLAISMNRPVSVHCVHAHGDMMKLLRKFDKDVKKVDPPFNLVMHSYGGSAEFTKSYLKLQNINVYFSLCLNRKIQLCQVIPVERLLFQTDAPHQKNTNLLRSINQNFKKDFKIDQRYSRPENILPNSIQLAHKYNIQCSKFVNIVFRNSKRAFRI